MTNQTNTEEMLRKEWKKLTFEDDNFESFDIRHYQERIADWWIIKFSNQIDQINEELEIKIGMLRQWLNEDRITDPNKMVTNEQIKVFFPLTTKEK